MAPVQPASQAVHWVALEQAVQCPLPMLLHAVQVPAVEQYWLPEQAGEQVAARQGRWQCQAAGAHCGASW